MSKMHKRIDKKKKRKRQTPPIDSIEKLFQTEPCPGFYDLQDLIGIHWFRRPKGK